MEVKPGYKQTEIGVIPETWEATTIGEVANFSGGSQPPRSTFRFTPTNGYIRLIQIRDYKTDDFATFIPEAMARKKCTAKDIMIGRYGPPIFQILRGLEGAYNVALIKTTPSEKIDREYFFNVLKQDTLFQLIEALSRRSSGQTGVEIPALKAFGLPLPPLSEQRAIAAALSDVDALIDALNQLIAKKRDLKQAAMQELLTGKKRLAGFGGEWDFRPLSAISEIKTGPFGSALHEKDYVQTGTPIITVEHLGERGVVHENLPMVSEKDRHRLNAYSLQTNDIVFSRVGSVDRNALIREVEDGWLFSGRLLRIRPNEKFIYSPFLSYYFHQEPTKQRIRAVAVGQTMASLNTAILKNIEVVVPTITEQQAVAEILSSLDAEIAALEQRLDKTRALKQGMMQELLTGRTRLV